jgi:ACS family tartrate transporter-like MFS transporter
LRGTAGLDGWQWLFLAEGAPAIVLGAVAFLYLTDRPEQARWLPDGEKASLLEALARERAETPRPDAHTIRAGLLDPLVWRFALMLFLIVTSGYSFSFFLSQIVRALSGGSDLAVGLLTALPFSLAAVGMATVAALLALAVAAVGLYAFTPPFWSLPTSFLRGDGAAAGIGLINASATSGVSSVRI